MPVFQYTCVDSTGKEVTGTISSDSARNARDHLREQKLFTYEIVEITTELAGGGKSGERFLTRVKPHEISIMTRQFAALIASGIPQIEALTALAEQEENPRFKKVLSTIKEKVREGKSLSDAFEEFPSLFPKFFVNLVTVGEESGELGVVLERLADYLEEQLRINGKVKSALAYPLFMTVIGTSVIAFLTVYVIPKVTGIFQDYGEALPLPTRVLLNISSFLSHYWYLLFLFIALVAGGIRWASRQERWKKLLDILLLKIPVVGTTFSNIAVADFSRTLGVLLASRISLVRALEITARTMQNSVFQEAIVRATKSIREGRSIADPLKKSGIFPAMVTQMIAVGERSGNLPEMLHRIAAAYGGFVENSLERMISLLEPTIILVMGLFVGFIVISILLPILEMSQLVG